MMRVCYFTLIFILAGFFANPAGAVTCSELAQDLSHLGPENITSPYLESIQTLDWFTNTLGSESLEKSLTPEAKTPEEQYKWLCPEDTTKQTYISVHVDANHNIKDYSGNYCCENEEATPVATSFRFSANDLKLLSAAANAPKLDPDVVPTFQAAQTVQQLKNEFGLTVEDHAQIQPIVTRFITDFYTALQNCTAGSYKYLMAPPFAGVFPLSSLGDAQVPTPLVPPLYIVAQADIQGFEGEMCLVKTSTMMPAVVSPSGADINFSQQCQFKLQDLALFTPDEAELAGQGKTGSDSPLVKVMDSSCKDIW